MRKVSTDVSPRIFPISEVLRSYPKKKTLLTQFARSLEISSLISAPLLRLWLKRKNKRQKNLRKTKITIQKIGLKVQVTPWKQRIEQGSYIHPSTTFQDQTRKRPYFSGFFLLENILFFGTKGLKDIVFQEQFFTLHTCLV